MQTVRGLELLHLSSLLLLTPQPSQRAMLGGKTSRQMPKLWTADRWLLDGPILGQALPGPSVPLEYAPAGNTQVKGHISSMVAPKSGHTPVFQSSPHHKSRVPRLLEGRACGDRIASQSSLSLLATRPKFLIDNFPTFDTVSSIYFSYEEKKK